MDAEINKILNQIKTEPDFFIKAKLLNFLNKEKQVKIKELANQLNFKPSYICHIVRLNRLPEIIRDGYYSKLISVSHLFVISRIKDKKILMSLYEKLLGNNLTVLQTELLVREVLYGVKTEGKYIAKEEINNLIEKIKNKENNISVKVIQTRIKSKLVIEILGDLATTSARLRDFLERLNLKNKI